MFSNTLAEKGKRETRLEGEEKWNGELVFFFWGVGFLRRVLNTFKMGKFQWRGND